MLQSDSAVCFRYSLGGTPKVLTNISRLELPFVTLVLLVVTSVPHVGFALNEEKVLYSFDVEGANPLAGTGLTFDSQGNLYGTTAGGGLGNCVFNGCGVVFKLTAQPGGHWGYRVLYAFKGESDGSDPNAVSFDS